MISHKLIPSFFVVDLEGEAANLEWLFGFKAKIKNATINSFDFKSDVEAAVAGQEVYDIIKMSVDTQTAEETSAHNPEFFLKGVPEPTLEQEQDEMLALFRAHQMEQETTLLTKRFDEWGDFVIMKSETRDSSFRIRMKVAANPQRYIEEKNKEQQDHDARLHGNKFESDRLSLN